MRVVASQPILLLLYSQLVSLLLATRPGFFVEAQLDVEVFPSTTPSTTSTAPSQMVSSIIVASEIPSTVPSTATPSLSLSPSTSHTPTMQLASSNPSTPLPSTHGSLSPSIPVSRVPSSTPSTAAPSITGSPTTAAPLPSSYPSDFPSKVPSVAPSNSFNPSASLAPSVEPSQIPSLHPTETSGPTPSPSKIPSFQPSITLLPTASPSLSQIPSRTSMPSSEPSALPSIWPSSYPTSSPTSNQPSATPSFAPTRTPSLYPTPVPTTNPSQPPSVTLVDIRKAVIEIIFTNMPILTDESSIRTWEQVTSTHVVNYWNELAYSPIIIDQASAHLIEQQKYAPRRRLQGDAASVAYFYSQNITYGVLRADGIGSTDVLFLRPFERDEQDYTTALVTALGLDPTVDLSIAAIDIREAGTQSPAQAPSVTPLPVMAAPPPPISSDGVSITVVVVVVILAVSFFLTTLGLVLAFNYHRYKEKQTAWSADAAASKQHSDGEDGEYSLNDTPPQINIKPSSKKDDQSAAGFLGSGNDLDSEIDPYSSMASGSYLMKDSDLSYQVQDEFDDSLRSDPDSSSLHGPPTSSLLGGDFDMNEEELNDIRNDDDDNMIADLPMHARMSSYGSSLDDNPSLTAFNIQVIDIDDVIDDNEMNEA